MGLVEHDEELVRARFENPWRRGREGIKPAAGCPAARRAGSARRRSRGPAPPLAAIVHRHRRLDPPAGRAFAASSGLKAEPNGRCSRAWGGVIGLRLPRSTIPGRWGRTVAAGLAVADSCSARWPGHRSEGHRTRPRRRCRCRIFAGRPSPVDIRGQCRVGHPQGNIASTGYGPPRSRVLLAAWGRVAAGGRCQNRSRSACR